MCGTLTPKGAASRSIGAVPALLAMHTRSSGGSSETEVKLFAVSPTGVPAGSSAVTIVIPVAKQPIASRSVRSEEHTSELQSLMRISYAVFCLKKKTIQQSIYKGTTAHSITTNQYDHYTSLITIHNDANLYT